MSSLLNNSEGILSPETERLNTPEEVEAESENKKEDPMQELLETLKEYDDSPDIMQLNEWKDLYGMFFASSSNGEDIYLWRTLKRREYKTIAESGAMEKQDLFENSIVRKCLIWPAPTPALFSVSDAGLMPTLFKQIMNKSGFVSDEVAISMIRRI